jgi:hypothetical protein
VAWFPGDAFPRLYHTDEPRFAAGPYSQLQGGKSIFNYRGSTCGVTADSGVYCINGDNPESQILVTSYMTYRGRDAQPSS